MIGFGKTALAVAALAGLAGTASALEIVAGTYEFEGDITAYNLEGPDPESTMTGDDTSDPILTARLESHSGGGNPYYVTNYRFEPSAPVTFGEVQSFSMDYEVLSGAMGGGSLRAAFVLDANNNGVEEIGPNGAGNPSTTGDQYMIMHLYFVDGIGYATPAGPQSTGNLIGAPDSTNDDWAWNYGADYHNYADTLAAFGNLNVLSVNLIHDAGNGAEFQVSNMFLQVPEPGSLGLLGLGALGLIRRRKNG